MVNKDQFGGGPRRSELKGTVDDSLLENKERSAILFNAIAMLPESQRTAFTLHKVEGLSQVEIAEILETSVSAVESLIVRAKKKLQDILSSYYEKNER